MTSFHLAAGDNDGDPAGIGPEIIAKLAGHRAVEHAYVVIGDAIPGERRPVWG